MYQREQGYDRGAEGNASIHLGNVSEHELSYEVQSSMFVAPS